MVTKRISHQLTNGPPPHDQPSVAPANTGDLYTNIRIFYFRTLCEIQKFAEKLKFPNYGTFLLHGHVDCERFVGIE